MEEDLKAVPNKILRKIWDTAQEGQTPTVTFVDDLEKMRKEAENIRIGKFRQIQLLVNQFIDSEFHAVKKEEKK